MSTLDVAGNSNGEIPTVCWKLSKSFPRLPYESHVQYVNRLMQMYRSKAT